jgi:RNA polymerase sigma-70 factor, ECF subfamily
MRYATTTLPAGSAQDGQSLDRFRPDLYRFIRRKGFSREEADDLTQETLLRACAHVTEFRSSHLAPWLYRIAANLCVDYRRKRRLLTVPIGEELLAGTETDPLDAFDRNEERRALNALVESLPECHRRILRLRYYEDQSMAEIAGQVRCSPLAAKLRVYRAVNALRKRCKAGG